MKQLFLGLVVLGLFLAVTGQANADPAVYTVNGVASGTFEGHSFTNVSITLTLAYDTDNVVGGYYGPPDPHPPYEQEARWSISGTGAVSVAGIGSADLGTGSLYSHSTNTHFYGTRGPVPSELDLSFAGHGLYGGNPVDFFAIDGGGG
jgi:hypothetical protein